MNSYLCAQYAGYKATSHLTTDTTNQLTTNQVSHRTSNKQTRDKRLVSSVVGVMLSVLILFAATIFNTVSASNLPTGYRGDPIRQPDPGLSEICPINLVPGQTIFNACYKMLGYTKPFSSEEKRDIKACQAACQNTGSTSDSEVGSGQFAKGELLFDSSMDTPESVKGWRMEGPGIVDFRNGWMHMFSAKEKGHHVYWCPETFPNSFIAEWEAQNLETDAGLSIVFFAAKGVNGEDIFDPSLPKRDGQFKHYTRGRIDSYHISYYANTPGEPDRGHANLRKNVGQILVQQGEDGIGTTSEKIHKIQLIKDGPHIVMFVDDRRVIDWTDNDKKLGPAHTDGKIGFRQMKWTHFRYRNFKIWSLDETQNQAPVVDAGENQVITLSEELILSGDVKDDGLPSDNVTLNWSMVSGPGVVYFISPNTIQTTATFSAIGTYELQLSADDGELSSSDRIIISVNSGYPGDPIQPPDPGPSEICPINPVPGQTIFNACYKMLGYTKPFSSEEKRDIKACQVACQNTSPSSDPEVDSDNNDDSINVNCPVNPAPGQTIFNACYKMLDYTKPFSSEEKRDIKACQVACKNTSPASDSEVDSR